MRGFTLIELLVVIAIIGILSVGLLTVINPADQFNRARDAKRQQDLTQIKTALDAYYNDYNRYPQDLRDLSPFYIKELPENIVYALDTSNSQWNVLFAKLARTESAQTSCALRSLANCSPENFNVVPPWACSLSGKVDCTYLTDSSKFSLPSSGIVPTSGPQPTTGVAATLTPTPTPTATSTPVAPILCQDGSNEQIYSSTMVGCDGGSVTYSQAAALCKTGSAHLCSIDEFLVSGGQTTPQNVNGRWLETSVGTFNSCNANQQVITRGVQTSGSAFLTYPNINYFQVCGQNPGYFASFSKSFNTVGAVCCSN